MFTVVFAVAVAVAVAAALVLLSFHKIGPAEVGLVTRRFSQRKLSGDNPVAFEGEAG